MRMRPIIVLLVQIFVAFLLVGAALPAVLLSVPSARTPGVGLPVVLGSLVAGTILVRWLWPRAWRGE
jgi:hypothetical protein